MQLGQGCTARCGGLLTTARSLSAYRHSRGPSDALTVEHSAVRVKDTFWPGLTFAEGSLQTMPSSWHCPALIACLTRSRETLSRPGCAQRKRSSLSVLPDGAVHVTVCRGASDEHEAGPAASSSSKGSSSSSSDRDERPSASPCSAVLIVGGSVSSVPGSSWRGKHFSDSKDGCRFVLGSLRERGFKKAMLTSWTAESVLMFRDRPERPVGLSKALMPAAACSAASAILRQRGVSRHEQRSHAHCCRAPGGCVTQSFWRGLSCRTCEHSLCRTAVVRMVFPIPASGPLLLE